MSATTPLQNDSVFYEAAGNLAFLLSVVRCGEKLSEDEERNVRRVIERLRVYEPILAERIRMLDAPERARTAIGVALDDTKGGPIQELLHAAYPIVKDAIANAYGERPENAHAKQTGVVAKEGTV